MISMVQIERFTHHLLCKDYTLFCARTYQAHTGTKYNTFILSWLYAYRPSQ